MLATICSVLMRKLDTLCASLIAYLCVGHVVISLFIYCSAVMPSAEIVTFQSALATFTVAILADGYDSDGKGVD